MRLNETGGQLLLDLGDQAMLDELEKQLFADKRPKLVVSDFDDTLCHEYDFDPETSTSLPIIDQELAAAARKLPLLIATSTRAAHPKINTIWESGMLAPGALLIAEGGGVIVDKDKNTWWAATGQDEIHELHTHVREALPKEFSLPGSMRLVIKPGMTLLIVRAQQQDGKYDFRVHAELQKALQNTVGPEWSVIDGGRSLSVQRPDVNKVSALGRIGLKRADYCLIGLGDSPNDIDLLTEADVAITVGDRITQHGDIQLNAHAQEVTTVLRTIGKATLDFDGWRRESDVLKNGAWH